MTNLPKDIWVAPNVYRHKEWAETAEWGGTQYTDKAKADAEKLTLSTTIECLDKTRLHLDKRIAKLERVLKEAIMLEDTGDDMSNDYWVLNAKEVLEEKS